MSEQSGPITREQVERAIDGMREKPGMWHVIEDALGRGWKAPEYVVSMWVHGSWDGTLAALTRWRDELAAAEPVRRVARWDADLDAYALTPIHDDGALMTHAVEDAAKARDWGYEIEGGPERLAEEERLACAYRESDGTLVWDDSPLPEPAEDSPERLRERREALGWTTAYAGHWVPWFNHTDVERAECGRGVPAFVARYAAALSAEEARLAAKAEPERPAPRFKVGDWVRHGTGMAWRVDEVRDLEDCHAFYGALGGFIEGPEVTLTLTTRDLAYDEPASPPAPEVVDVPQPRIVVKRCDEVEAEWTSADATILIVTHDALDDAIFVPIALLRAMLAAIDAQQGGAL